eukprot:10330003-Lingulodinium_polyedra.AAC.1
MWDRAQLWGGRLAPWRHNRRTGGTLARPQARLLAGRHTGTRSWGECALSAFYALVLCVC